MAMGLVFSAMAHNGNGLALREILKLTQGEVLSVVFDGAVVANNWLYSRDAEMLWCAASNSYPTDSRTATFSRRTMSHCGRRL